MSTYGDVLLAGVDSGDNTTGQIYFSTDGGSNWTPQSAPSSSWGCVFCSADGTLLTAGENEYGTDLYSAANPLKPPTLTMIKTANQSILSWPEFPAGFEPQVNANLNAAGSWMYSTNVIILSGTNYFMTNSLAASTAFFRLVRP